MAEEKLGSGRFANLKDMSSLLRDALLTVVIAICLIHPASIKTFLKESGLSKLGMFGVTVELQEEKEKVAEAQREVTSKVVPATAPGEPPPEALNKPVDQDFKQAILTAERVAPQILPTAGWVFLGRVDSAKSQWLDGGSPTTTATWPVKPDDIVTVKDDVYIRKITDDKWHSSAPVASVAKVGDQLKVVELQYSSARAGGFFVWAKVALRSN
ncbi:hypothetical protein [Lysobacter terrae]